MLTRMIYYFCQLLLFVKVNESHSVVSHSFRPHGLYSPWNSLGQNAGVGSLFFLQRILPTQELNQGLLHCRWILCQLSYEGSPLPAFHSPDLRIFFSPILPVTTF